MICGFSDRQRGGEIKEQAAYRRFRARQLIRDLLKDGDAYEIDNTLRGAGLGFPSPGRESVRILRSSICDTAKCYHTGMQIKLDLPINCPVVEY